MATVEFEGVRKAFGATMVIHGADLKIADGEFLVLVGPSGCGKSTLLRLVAGLEELTGGTIRVDGRVVNDEAPKDRDIAMVFQNYALYPHMTVARNMGFALQLAGVPRAEIAARVADAAKILGLDTLLERYPRQLSGGQRQRVAMGRAIVRKPKVFLFDEPLSNLDAKLRISMRSEIKALHQRLTTTTIYVTHDQTEAMTLADRIVVMRDGIIEQIGTPLEVYDRPANMFVAGFIGAPSMNFLEAVRGTDGKITLAGGPDRELVQATSSGPQGRLIVGVRPEELLRDEAGFEAMVRLVEPTGSETQVTVDLAGQQVTCLFRDRIEAEPGQVLRILPRPAKAHLFDAMSGKRID